MGTWGHRISDSHQTSQTGNNFIVFTRVDLGNSYWDGAVQTISWAFVSPTLSGFCAMLFDLHLQWSLDLQSTLNSFDVWLVMGNSALLLRPMELVIPLALRQR